VFKAQAELRDELIAQTDPGFWGEVALSFLPWAPTVDGQTIPGAPIDRIRAGEGAEVDLLVGTNAEETRLFFLSDGSIDRITNEALVAMATAYGLSEDGLAAYRAAHPGGTAGDLFSAIQTDGYWRQSGWRMPTRPTHAPRPTCTSSLGVRHRWAAASVRHPQSARLR
jgi:para-nitrobenzyl esterase